MFLCDDDNARRRTSRTMPSSEPGGHLMPPLLRFPTARSGRIFWPTLAFLVGFAVLIYVISDWYLLPALDAARNANTTEKKQLAAHARLLLAIVLVTLICGIMLNFRSG